MKKSFLNICGRFNKNGERIKERGINLYMKNVIIKINPMRDIIENNLTRVIGDIFN